MPASRCSDCGRFMNADVGCRNSRCMTSDPVSSSSAVRHYSPIRQSPVRYQFEELPELTIRKPNNGITMSNHRSQNEDFIDRLAELEELCGEMKKCYLRIDQRSTANMNAVANLRSFADAKYCELNTMYDELQKSVVHMVSTHKNLAAEQASAANKKYAELTTSEDQLKESVSQISSSHEKLAAEYVKFVTDRVEVQSKQNDVNKDFIIELKILENRLIKLDESITHKLDQKMAIDSSTAEEFHSSVNQKYNQLDAMYNDQQALLNQIVDGQKELASNNISLLNEQTELKCKLVELEKKQLECSCSELQMMIARNTAKQEKLEPKIAKLVEDQQIELNLKLSEVENTLVEQRSLISDVSESQEKKLIALIMTVADALDLKIHLEDIEEPTLSGNSEASEELEAESIKELFLKQLINTIVVKMKNENKPPVINWGHIYYTVAVIIIALVINFFWFF